MCKILSVVQLRQPLYAGAQRDRNLAAEAAADDLDGELSHSLRVSPRVTEQVGRDCWLAKES